MRRGAASCRAVLGSCPVAAAAVGRGAGAVTAEPSWVTERPRRRDPGEGRSAQRVSPVARCPDAGRAGRCPVRLVRSAVGISVQPVERTSSIQVSGVRYIQVSGRTSSGVCGAAAALSAPRWTPEWLGVVGRAGRTRRVDVPRGPGAA